MQPSPASVFRSLFILQNWNSISINNDSQFSPALKPWQQPSYFRSLPPIVFSGSFLNLGHPATDVEWTGGRAGQLLLDVHSTLILKAAPGLSRWWRWTSVVSEAAHEIKGNVNPRKAELVQKVGEESEKADIDQHPALWHGSQVSGDRQGRRAIRVRAAGAPLTVTGSREFIPLQMRPHSASCCPGHPPVTLEA